MTLRERLARAVEGMPAEASVSLPVAWLRDRLAEDGEEGAPELEREPGPAGAVEWTWRERIWACPAETRLTVEDAAEALARSASWIYKRTAPSADPGDRLPARKAHGGLVFTAGELRTWIRDHEESENGVPMTTTEAERRAWKAS